MTTIINVELLEDRPQLDGKNYVVHRFTTSEGDVIIDGPRFLSPGDYSALTTDLGQRILDDLAQQEMEAWLLS